MKFTIFASGSSGNSTLIETNSSKILIDCGTTKKYLSSRFDERSLLRKDLSALVLTHNHGDHIQQIKHFSEVPTYSPFHFEHYQRTAQVIPYQSFMINDVSFTPIELSHDTDITVGYVVEANETKLVYITDTGYVKANDLHLLNNADYYIIESNFDPELLMKSNRPYLTKQRILSDKGHLSNEACGELLREVVGENTKHIVLAHMSLEANEPSIALTTIRSYLNGYQGELSVAEQFNCLEVGFDD